MRVEFTIIKDGERVLGLDDEYTKLNNRHRFGIFGGSAILIGGVMFVPLNTIEGVITCAFGGLGIYYGMKKSNEMSNKITEKHMISKLYKGEEALDKLCGLYN